MSKGRPLTNKVRTSSSCRLASPGEFSFSALAPWFIFPGAPLGRAGLRRAQRGRAGLGEGEGALARRVPSLPFPSLPRAGAAREAGLEPGCRGRWLVWGTRIPRAWVGGSDRAGQGRPRREKKRRTDTRAPERKEDPAREGKGREGRQEEKDVAQDARESRE